MVGYFTYYTKSVLSKIDGFQFLALLISMGYRVNLGIFGFRFLFLCELLSKTWKRKRILDRLGLQGKYFEGMVDPIP